MTQNATQGARLDRTVVYLVGTGRMGRLVARRLAPSVDLVLVGRDSAKLAVTAREVGARTALLDTDFAGAEAVILALPTEATVPVLAALAPRIPQYATVINVATAVLRKDLEHLVPATRLAGAKFVGHYYDMEAGGSVQVVVEAGGLRAEQIAREVMRQMGPVVSGQEEWVLTANKIAAEEGVRMAIRIQQRLEAAGIPEAMIRQAISAVSVGSTRAFMDGKLGPFGQAIADRVRAELASTQK